MRYALILLLLLAGSLVLSACEPGPRDLRYGEEECAYCVMRVSERAFASQLVTRQGRTHAFDSIECLTAFVERGDVAEADIHSIWVPNFADAEGDWVPAAEAVFLQSEAINSPMGLSLTAYADRTEAETDRDLHGGTLYDWSEVRRLVQQAWLTDEAGGREQARMHDH